MITKVLDRKLMMLAAVGAIAAFFAVWLVLSNVAAQTPPPVAFGVESAEPGDPGTPGVAIAVHRDVHIDFDNVNAPCVFVDAGPLDNQYSALGVVFSGGGEILNSCSSFGVSGFSAPNFVAFNTGSSGNGPPETMTFSTPVKAVEIRAGVGGRTLTLTAFKGAAQVDQVVANSSSTLQTYVVQGSGIDKVVLNYSGGCCLVFDDLAFDLEAIVDLTPVLNAIALLETKADRLEAKVDNPSDHPTHPGHPTHPTHPAFPQHPAHPAQPDLGPLEVKADAMEVKLDALEIKADATQATAADILVEVLAHKGQTIGIGDEFKALVGVLLAAIDQLEKKLDALEIKADALDASVSSLPNHPDNNNGKPQDNKP